MNTHFLTRRLFAACAFLLGLACLPAHAETPIPRLNGRVLDYSNTLTLDQKSALGQTLGDFESRKGSQIVVLLVQTTAPETIEQYSMRVVEQWKLGRKTVDDGVLLVIAKQDRALRIEVGYGLEGVLTDAVSKRIISDTITPHLKSGDYYAGISAGVAQMMRVIDGEALPEPVRARQGQARSSSTDNLPVILIFALVIGGFLRSIIGRLAGSVVTGGLVAAGAWLLLGSIALAAVAGVVALMFTLLGGGMGMGGFGMGGRSFGSGRGGGFGGGGFSGGGGGGFGGGGASGRF